MIADSNGNDIRALPAYSISEVAHYLGVPAPTIRYWSVGGRGHGPLIEPPAGGAPTLLSFFNLTELHVLSAVRRKHGVKMSKIRRAIQYLKSHACGARDERHPLISREMVTDGLHLFIEEYGKLINISQQGQMAMRDVIEGALRRIRRDAAGLPVKLYPFTRNTMEDAPEMVVIDPALSAGRPVIAGTGITTQIIAERYMAGESIDDLAKDYERPHEEIEEAIRCEFPAAA